MGFSQFPTKELGLDLLFGNGDVGKKIIEGLKKELGKEDLLNRLRVSIIKGVSAKEPCNYKVVLSENFTKSHDRKLTMSVSRIHTMTPKTLDNLDRFLLEFSSQKSFILGYGTMKGGQYVAGFDTLTCGIKINNLVVLEAWQIGTSDIEQSAITIDDDPIIPEGVTNAPIMDVLKVRANR